METEAAVEARAEAAIARAKINKTSLSTSSKTIATKAISNNMAITNKEAVKELQWMESGVKPEATKTQWVSNTSSKCSSSNNNSFSCHRLTFPTSTRS